ncbi:MAG: Tex family protein [Thomasclavelia sp.]|nr:Tex family protein [Thomasclavelia sp.]
MENSIVESIAKELNISNNQINNTLSLIEEGSTIPFIARYRKEKTGNLDEEQIKTIFDTYNYQLTLSKRKEDVMRLIETQGKLTDDIVKEINACLKLSEVEDVYRPYKQKKKTRATDAIAKGLQPLADFLLACPRKGDVSKEANKYLSDDVKTIEEAIQGAKDIIAEVVSDKAKLRWKVKESILKYGKLVTKEKKNNPDEQKVYKMYYDRTEKISYIASHRIMAIDRAEKEKVITVSFDYDKGYYEKYALRGITRDRETTVLPYLEDAVKDGFKRLLFPSVEREIRSELTDKAQAQSIEVFSMNVEKLLMQPPLLGKMVLGFDPAFRTGCKLAVIDETGKMLKIAVIYPHQPVNKKAEATKILLDLFKQYPIKIVAIGNGTASRESESFVAEVIKNNNLDIEYTLVSEAGASVYSASKNARDEFPDLTVEKRSAISIARRVIDPLAELIKIDPQSIGVGQYQHDLKEKELAERLDFVVLKAVNQVGVDVNTASKELLSHVSGLTKSTAQAIVDLRNEKGIYTNRKEILKAKKLGAKGYTQAVGFLRVTDGSEPLDQTSIHPESYDIAKQFMKEVGIDKLGEKIDKDLNLEAMASKLNTDVYTLQDIKDAIETPLRDVRDKYDGPLLRSDIVEIEDLHEGDQLQGVVRNVVDFGAFVDIGLHEDGLVHISKLGKRVNHPSEILSVGDIVEVGIYKIDNERNKVQLELVSK